MDEILASIRKIIESNEPGMPGFPANDAGVGPNDLYDDAERPYDDAEYQEEIRLTIEDDMLVAGFETETKDARFSEPAQSPAPVELARASTPPLSLADVAARVRAASERHSSVPMRPADAGQTAAESPTTTYRSAPVAVVTSEKVEQAPTPSARQAVSSANEVVETTASQPGTPDRPEAEASPAPVVGVDVGVPDVAFAAEKEVAAIVSPAVGQQVARSFEDLALAVDSGPRRSFDDIAQEMLRPMLQEWLDDNLPTLVERLVREEIERVARGPRR